MEQFILTDEKMNHLSKDLGYSLQACHGGWVGTKSGIIREDIQKSMEIEGTRPGYMMEDIWNILPESLGDYILVLNKFSGVTYWNPGTNEILVSFKEPSGLLEGCYKMLEWLLLNKKL